jgi:YHS domain-containing protein
MLQGIFRIILYGFLIYLVYLLYRFFKALSRVKKTQSNPSRHQGLMVKDEYCNTYLPKEDAIKEVIEGKEYYFCSKECRQKFIETKKS